MTTQHHNHSSILKNLEVKVTSTLHKYLATHVIEALAV
jgi:hypothetical protein